MRRVKSHVPDGTSRWECPARARKVGCPHVTGTVQDARDLGMPIVAQPPAGPDLRISLMGRFNSPTRT